MTNFPIIVGRAEKLTLVGLANDVPAKIDTGAFNSAIHCTSVKEEVKNGKKVLKVTLLGHPCSPETYDVMFNKFNVVSVTNSFGQEEERYEVNLRVKLGPKIFNSPFTLADRKNNLFPILLGRKLLKKRFVVDVAKTGVDRLALKNGRATLEEIN